MVLFFFCLNCCFSSLARTEKGSHGNDTLFFGCIMLFVPASLLSPAVSHSSFFFNAPNTVLDPASVSKHIFEWCRSNSSFWMLIIAHSIQPGWNPSVVIHDRVYMRMLGPSPEVEACKYVYKHVYKIHDTAMATASDVDGITDYHQFRHISF